MSTDLTISLAGEGMHLLPERALFWPRRAALIVADLHWGKDATFRAAGLGIPHGAAGDDLARLERALVRTGAARLLLLGDLLHARAGREPATFARVAEWRARHPALEVTLVRGNHDRSAGDPPAEWGFACADEPLLDAPFVLRHYPQPTPGGYVLAGHLHPAARLRGAGRQQLRLPCFWFSPEVGVLPAFGSFTGGAPIAPAPTDRVFVLADNTVIEIE